MPKPNLCPDKMYEIMMACWRKEPQERPTFETLQWQLEDFYQMDPKQYKELDKQGRLVCKGEIITCVLVLSTPEVNFCTNIV